MASRMETTGPRSATAARTAVVRLRCPGEPVQVLEVAPQRSLTVVTIAYIPHDRREPAGGDHAGEAPPTPATPSAKTLRPPLATPYIHTKPLSAAIA